MPESSFEGKTVLSLESRQAVVMAEGITRHGGNALVAPSMQEIPLETNPEVRAFAGMLERHEIDMLILMTGVGTRYLLEILYGFSGEEAVLRELERATLVARGPKPVQVLRKAGLRPEITVPEPNTWYEILEVLDSDREGLSLAGKAVAVQEYGAPNERLLRELKQRGARLIRVPVYRWALPDDRRPLLEAIRRLKDHSVDFTFLTNAVQIRHFLQVAAEAGCEEEIKAALRKTVIASIGPACSEAIHEQGLPVDFEPSHPKMGHLIAETARESRDLLAAKRVGIDRPVIEIREAEPGAGRKTREDSVFMRACRLKKTTHTPVWLMRQAGRYMKEYRAVRSRYGFLELCKNRELCTEVTVYAQEKIGADAAIIFSDLLLPVEPMGLGLEYTRGEGPQITGGVNNRKEVDAIREFEPRESLGYVLEAIRLTRSALRPGIPLIGFAGAPFTLVSYMLEGGASRVFLKTKQLMYTDGETWQALMEKVSRVLGSYLRAQVEAGADAVQVFDSWVGCMGPSDYRRYVQPYTQKVLDSVKGMVPVIHFGTGTGTFLPALREAGGDVIGVDFRMELGEAWKTIGYDRAVQGNMDPAALLAPLPEIRRRAKAILDQAGGRPGHIFNLGHGILPQTPVDHVRALIDFVHEYSARAAADISS